MFKSILAGCVLSALTAVSTFADVIPALRDALPQEYKDNGIKAAVFNDWAPDEYLDADGQLKGWSVDLAKEMEVRLGVPFTFEGTSFDAIIPGLQSKRFDAGFSSFGTGDLLGGLVGGSVGGVVGGVYVFLNTGATAPS